MNSMVRRTLAVLVALAVTFGIAALSRVPYAADESDRALVRFSWRTPSAFVEECRRLSQEEIERLPVHMRREEVCEGRVLPYRLLVRIDGRTVYDELVRAAGARGDRPLYVFRELPAAPGEYLVEVLWEREGLGAAEPAVLQPLGGDGLAEATEAADPPVPRHRTTTPERLALTVRLHLAPGDVGLITYDLDRQLLTARGRGVLGSGSDGDPPR
jgi:hypothetical protein